MTQRKASASLMRDGASHYHTVSATQGSTKDYFIKPQEQEILYFTSQNLENKGTHDKIDKNNNAFQPQKGLVQHGHRATSTQVHSSRNPREDKSGQIQSHIQKGTVSLLPGQQQSSNINVDSNRLAHVHVHSPRRSARDNGQSAVPLKVMSHSVGQQQDLRAVSTDGNKPQASKNSVVKKTSSTRENNFQKSSTNHNNPSYNANANPIFTEEPIEEFEASNAVHLQQQHMRNNFRRPLSKQAPDPRHATFENLKELIKQQQLEFNTYQQTYQNPLRQADSVEDHHQQNHTKHQHQQHQQLISPRDASSQSREPKNQQPYAKQASAIANNNNTINAQFVHSQQQLSTNHETASKLYDDRTWTMQTYPSQPSYPQLANQSKIQPSYILTTKEDERRFTDLDQVIVPSSFEAIYSSVVKTGFNATHPMTNSRPNANVNEVLDALGNANYDSTPPPHSKAVTKAGSSLQRRKKLSIISDIQFEDLFESTPKNMQLCPKRIDNHLKHPFEPAQYRILAAERNPRLRKPHLRSHSESSKPVDQLVSNTNHNNELLF